jgi:hypothetical protein
VLGVFKAGLVARGVIRHARIRAPLLPLTGTEARTVVERVGSAEPGTASCGVVVRRPPRADRDANSGQGEA